ncbi:MAG: hypothetical protein K0S70_5011 [Microbacterium sp.]|jgi:DNA-binding transcriptional ArsR family regulator|nr:hypothetical protein [Microbacterium sp.]
MTTTPRRQPIPHPAVEELSLQRVMDALSDPVRRMVATQLALAGHEISCGSFDTPVSNSTLTHHFTVLREAGLIRQYYSGTTKMNALRLAEIDDRFSGILSAVIAAESSSPTTG